MSLDFMTPDVWDGLVMGVVLIGLSLAIVRLMSDRSAHQRQQRRAQAARDAQQITSPDANGTQEQD